MPTKIKCLAIPTDFLKFAIEGLREVRKTCPTATFYRKNEFPLEFQRFGSLNYSKVASSTEFVEALLTANETDQSFVQEVVDCAVPYYRAVLSEEDQKKLPEKLRTLVLSSTMVGMCSTFFECQGRGFYTHNS